MPEVIYERIERLLDVLADEYPEERLAAQFKRSYWRLLKIEQDFVSGLMARGAA